MSYREVFKEKNNKKKQDHLFQVINKKSFPACTEPSRSMERI